MKDQREAEEQMRRYEEERRRVYEMSMGGAVSYQATSDRLDREKSAAQLAMEKEQRKRDEAVKKAREQAMERLKQEKAQRQMEKDVYQRLAELRRPAPATPKEKEERIVTAQKRIAEARERLKDLMILKDEVKHVVELRRKREEEERKKKEEEERKKREEEEKRRKEEEVKEAERKRKEEEEKRKKKAAEEEARRAAAELRKRELEKEKEAMRKEKQKAAQAMEERLMQDELRLLDCREKWYELKKLLKEVKAGKK